MNYCEKCNSLSNFEYCSVCGNKKVREANSDDFCFLTECEQMYGEMLKDILQEEGISCALMPWGNGVRTQLGLRLDRYKVYVPYRDYERSVELLRSFSNGPSTEDLKEQILDNIDKWHIVKPRTAKKICKKLNINEDADIFIYIKECVEKSQCIEDKGMLSSFPRSEHGLAVKIDDVTLWFSSESYEICI